MERILKPVKLAIDPNSPKASKEWKHWIRTFKGYVSRFVSVSSETTDEDKLAALISCATADIYEYFDHCETYAEAEEVLEKLYVKKPNEIFARYLLRTAKQEPSQTLSDFQCTLLKLAKDCEFKAVTAAQYKDDLVRDSFINGISSAEIRQRLLEKKTLNMKNAYSIAMTMADAKRDNQFFCNSSSVSAEPQVVSAVNDDAQSMNENKEVTSAVTKSACFHCGSNKNHDYKKCSAISLTCYSCGNKGHISRACSRRKSS